MRRMRGAGAAGEFRSSSIDFFCTACNLERCDPQGLRIEHALAFSICHCSNLIPSTLSMTNPSLVENSSHGFIQKDEGYRLPIACTKAPRDQNGKITTHYLRGGLGLIEEMVQIYPLTPPLA